MPLFSPASDTLDCRRARRATGELLNLLADWAAEAEARRMILGARPTTCYSADEALVVGETSRPALDSRVNSACEDGRVMLGPRS